MTSRCVYSDTLLVKILSFFTGRNSCNATIFLITVIYIFLEIDRMCNKSFHETLA